MQMKKRVLALIPARGGSKGIPQKNMVLLAGKPLIQWTIEAAKSARCVTQIAVSTDADDILKYVANYDLLGIKRPARLATDSAQTEPVITHALEYLEELGHEFDELLLLQPTSPLRTANDIEAAYGAWKEADSTALISVVKPKHHPMKAFVLNEAGHLKGMVNDELPFRRRQDLPPAFFANGAIYFVRIQAFKETGTLIQTQTSAYLMSDKNSIDIDSLEDLQVAQDTLESNSPSFLR